MTAALERATVAGPIRVVVAVGTRLACDAYAARLGTEADLTVVPAPGPIASLEQVAPSLSPNVLVVDPRAVQGEPERIAGLRRLRGAPDIVAVLGDSDRQLALQLVREGVGAAVLKTAPAGELVSAIRWTARGASWISPPILRYVLDGLHRGPVDGDERLRRLTPREREILQLMVDGLNRQEMAAQLFLSVDTVRTHTRTVMEKLGVHSGTAAVSVALTAGLRPSA